MWQIFRKWLVKKNSRWGVIASLTGSAATNTEALVAVIRTVIV